MTALSALWLPIVLSAVFVFVVSSVIHMFTGWHKNDYARLPNEGAVLDALRPLAIPPGDYMMPRAESRQELSSPEFAERAKRGPVVIMTVLPNGMMNMGSSLAQWFVYLLVISLLAAYVASRAVAPGADYLAVFRFAGVAAFLGYSAALWQSSIWYKRSWVTTAKVTVDGLIYGLVTAGTFGWLWPR